MIKYFPNLLILCLLSCYVPNQSLIIYQKPLELTKERVALMQQYNYIHNRKNTVIMTPQMIVVHWTAMKSDIQKTWEYFNQVRGSNRWFYRYPCTRKYGLVQVSAHYLVDRDGKVYQLLPNTIVGRHVIGLNYCSIGIENIGNNDLTQEQLQANIKLIEYLIARYPTIKYVIGHMEYRKFEGTALFKERFPEYRSVKSDPGIGFITDIRYALKRDGIYLKGLK